MKRAVILAAMLFVSSVAYGQCLLTTQTESVPFFTINEPVNFQIEAVSGTEPYHFTQVGGELPEGLHLTGSGKIVGKPRQTENTTVLIEITDAAGCSLTVAYMVETGIPQT